MNKKHFHDVSIQVRLMHMLLYAGRHTIQQMDTALEAEGLSGIKMWAMMQLIEAEEPLGISQLAQCIHSGKSNATQLVDRLEADGYVRRVQDARDRRRILIEVTDEGRQRFEEGEIIRRRVAHEIMSTLQPDEQSELENYLQKLFKWV